MTLTHVNGVEIIERQMATGMAGTAIAGKSVESVEELLLADGRTVYHCVHKNAPDCEYTADQVGSITSHQRTHSDRMMAKRALEAAEAAKADAARVQAELDARVQRRSEGSRQGHQTKLARKAQVPSVVGGQGRAHSKPGTPTVSVIGDTELAAKAQKVIIAYNALQDAHDQFQNVFLGYMRAVQVASQKPAIDPQILAKAQQYDIIQSALKGIK